MRATFVDALNETDGQTADHGTSEIPDPTQDSSCERNQAELGAGVVVRLRLNEEVQHSGSTCERSTECEGEGDRAVDIDAHQSGGVLILCHRTHGLAHFRPTDDESHAEQERRRDSCDKEQLVEIDALNDRTPPLDRPVLLRRTVDVVLLSYSAEDEAQPDSGHQRRK